MPRSGIWRAPEWHRRGFLPEAARRMDIFSFGLVCLWMLIGADVSQGSTRDDGKLISFDENGSGAQNLLEAWKRCGQKDELTTWALSLVPEHAELDERDLAAFFKATLAKEPSRRETNVSSLLRLLDPARNLPETTYLVAEAPPANEDFQISASFDQLYNADFRVPSFIVKELKYISARGVHSFQRISPKNAALQLAFSHASGFGVPQNDDLAYEILHQHAISLKDLEKQIRVVQEQEYYGFRSGLYIELNGSGLAYPIDFPQYYRERNLIKRAEITCKRDISATVKLLGRQHPVHVDKKIALSQIFESLGRWEAAEELEVQVLETRKTKLGADHPDTLSSMNNLAGTYSDQGRWEAAEELGVQALETSKTKLGADHPDTLTSMNNLASTYWNQGQWETAEELEVQVLETSKTKLGAGHPNTLSSMNNLAYIWRSQDRHTEALQLMKDCVSLRAQVLGPDHPDTVSASAALDSWQKEYEDES